MSSGEENPERQDPPLLAERPAQENSLPGWPRNILVIHDVLPHFDASGSDLRLMDVIREIRREGHAVTFVARHARNLEKYASPLRALGVNVVAGDPDRLKHIGEDGKTTWDLAELLRCGQFHAAILCHWFWSGISICEAYLDDIRRLSPETRILVLTDDRHGERERRLAAITRSFADFERGNDFETRELEVYRQADLVLYITEADKKRFLELAPELKLEHLPMQAALGPVAADFAARGGVLFFGNFENRANVEALKWMLEEVWPRVLKEDPEVQLVVAGNGTPREIEVQHRNLKCLGRVDDVAGLFSACRVFAAPIRYGTGINTKNLLAMALGLPVVTTSIGAEGIELEPGRDALVADTAQGFASDLLKLNRDAALWKQISERARDLVATRFSPEYLGQRIRRIIERAVEIAPKPCSPGHIWSFREVEESNPEVLTYLPRYRTPMRMLAYWQAGHRQLAEGRAAAALDQFRRVFCMQRGINPPTVLHARVVSDMAAAYRLLGDKAGQRRCMGEVQRLRSERHAAPASAASKKHKEGADRRAEGFDISVVIPTYNRREVLRACLCALAFQTFPAERWEIIVVDDGSTDGTAEWAREYAHPTRNLRFLRQANSGAGAARRAGVEAARGEFVLLMNDDTIAGPDLLAQHLGVHRKHPREKWAVLGGFGPSEDCAHRALSLWVNHSSFLFPQNSLKAGALFGSAYFVTCNLTVSRKAILDAGNFDAQFRVAEDTDLGARLEQRGYRVYFHPAAQAGHEHAQFTVNDLLRRALAYGRADWALFQKHPHLLGDGSGPFGLLREEDLARMRATIEKNHQAVRVSLRALEAMDQLEMAPLLQKRPDGTTAADGLWPQLNHVVPMVYWHYLFKSFLAARTAAAGAAAHTAESSVSQLATAR